MSVTPSTPSATFSSTVIASNSEKCWKTMPMPSARAALGSATRDGLAVPQHLALVGVQHAVDDLDQRALAGAVLAQQRVDLARRDGKPTSELATTPGNRLVIPRSSRRSGTALIVRHAHAALSCAARRRDGVSVCQAPAAARRRPGRRSLPAACRAARRRRSGRPWRRSAPRDAQLAKAALELGPLGRRADQPEIGEVAALEDGAAQREVEAVAVGQDERRALPAPPARSRPAAGR